MRTVLHRPRQRKRSIAAATLSALAILGSLLVATPAQALNDTGTGGVFVPATGRFLDTAKNIGGYDTAMPAKGWRTIQVTGTNGVPNDGSVGAVSVVATAASISNQGILYGRPNADAKSTLMGIYGGDDKQNTSFSAVLAVNSDGTIQVQAETSIRLILDVQGYYTASDDGTAAGGFVPLNGTRIADTRSGLGFPQQTIGAGERVDLQVSGRGGIPKGASGAIINMIAVNRTASVGYLTPYATGDTRPSNSFNYAGNVPTSMQAQVKLSADGKITIYNGSSTTDLVVDTQGYFTAAGKGGAVFTPGAGRAYDTRSTGNTVMGKNETRSIQIAGKAGVPVMGSGVSAVVLSLTSLKSTAGAGYATVWADGTSKPNTTSINFDETTIRTNTITVPLGANGKVAINSVADPTNYVFDVQGWYSDPAAPVITCGSMQSGTWLDSVPSSALACTVQSPLAATSQQSTDIYVDGELIASPANSATAVTSSNVNIPATSGQHEIQAVVKLDASDAGTQASFTIGFGKWSKAPFVTAPMNGATVDTVTTLEAILASNDISMPENATVSYAVADSATGTQVASSGAVPFGDWEVPTGVLADNANYAWSARVTAKDEETGDAVVKNISGSFRTDKSYVDHATTVVNNLAAGTTQYEDLSASDKDAFHAAADVAVIGGTNTVSPAPAPAEGGSTMTARAASKCFTGKAERVARSAANFKLYKSWTVGKWCVSGLTVKSASIAESGQSVFFPGWNTKGKINGGSAVSNNIGRAWTQYKFSFQLGSPVPTQETTPCTRVNGRYTSKYTADTGCSSY